MYLNSTIKREYYIGEIVYLEKIPMKVKQIEIGYYGTKALILQNIKDEKTTKIYSDINIKKTKKEQGKQTQLNIGDK